MATPPNPPGAVPTSSARNKSATHRTLVVAAVLLALVMVAMFVPW